MATTQPEMGKNKTGVARSPKLVDEMVEATRKFEPNPAGDEHFIAAVRSELARELEPAGSGSPPAGARGLATAAALKLKGGIDPVQLIDALGERLAFERSGVRVYEALLSKLEAFGEFKGGPTREELLHILTEEYEHFRLLEGTLLHLGADPTAVTPSANATATMTSGIVSAVLDPRTNLTHCLEGALMLELADNESWETLVHMTRSAGQTKIADSFEEASAQERDHVLNVREWVSAAKGLSA